MREPTCHYGVNGITMETICGRKTCQSESTWKPFVTCKLCRKKLGLGPYEVPRPVKGRKSGQPLKFKSGFTIQLYETD